MVGTQNCSLPKEKLTHKGIAVKGDSSFHRAPKPIWTEIRPCRNQTTKRFSPLGTRFTLAHPPVPSAVLIPQAFFIQGMEGCLIRGQTQKPRYSQTVQPGLVFSWERETAPHLPSNFYQSCVLNPQEFRKMPVEDTSNILKVLY